MIEWLKHRSFPTRVLLYTAAALLCFAVAAGVGAMTALMIQGGTPQRQGADADPSQQRKAAAEHNEAVERKTTPLPQEAGAERENNAPQQAEAQYVSKVGELQANSVETFLASHDKISRYDSLTADDVEEMQSNEANLQDITKQVATLDPPQRYGEQYEVFSSAISELYEGVRLAYNLAADPISATQPEFDKYDQHVSEAAAGLKRSNQLLGRDYETLQGAQEVSPLL
jgi:hypothetical protein